MRDPREDERIAPPTNRRAFTLGLASVALGLAGQACATPRLDPSAGSLPIDKTANEARLLANLLTRLAATVSVNGVPDLLFVLDTGAERTAIAADVAERLGLRTGSDILVHGVTAAQVAPSVHIDDIRFAGEYFRGIRAPVFSRELLGADGLLGLDVLSRFRFDLSVVSRSVRLVPSDDGTPIDRWAPMGRLARPGGMRARRGGTDQLILIGARANGIQVDVFVDSGAQYSIGNLALRDALYIRDPAVADPTLIRVFGVTGQVLTAQPGRLRQLEIGRERLGPTPMLFADLYAFNALGLNERPAILIGADVMSRFRRISLDFPNNQAFFEGVRRPRTVAQNPYATAG